MDAENNFRSDAILMEILEERKSVVGFLDAVFGFLRRKTDFYHVPTHPNERIGFEVKARELIVRGAVERNDPSCQLNCRVSAQPPDVAAQDEVPAAIAEVEVVAENIENIGAVRAASPEKRLAPKKVEFAEGDYKNGASFKDYCWSQTLTTLELHLRLPESAQKAKLLGVEIKPDSIAVQTKLQPKEVLLEGQLWSKVKHKEAIWTVSDGRLLITIDKSKEGWWDKLFTAEDSIDLKKLDCGRFVDDLPDDMQESIYKLRAKQNEAKADNESETIQTLRKAWDADDSPFKGQPFDPSMLKFS